MTASAAAAPKRGFDWRPLSRAAVALTAFLGGFVLREPAPYELLLVAFMALFIAFGLRLSRFALLLAILFVAFNFGGVLSMMQMSDLKDAPVYIAVSLFLGLSSVFFCALVEADAAILRTAMRATVAGGVVTALFGILGYFGAIPGAELFVRYDRAKGLFEDPNVFGPFLVLPALYAAYGVLYRSWTLMPLRAGALLILTGGIFLSFSRGAWGLLVIAGLVLAVLLLASEERAHMRARLILVGAAGLALLIVTLGVALQFEVVSEMFETRAQVVQEYDGARLGRFARHAVGFEWALTHPLGIGPLEFGRKLGEDTHNIWVKALMAYGWLGFAAYLAITIITLFCAGRILMRDRPWRPYLQILYATYVGHVLLAWVIDTDHWRHIHMVIGLIWGCMALEARQVRLEARQGRQEQSAWMDGRSSRI